MTVLNGSFESWPEPAGPSVATIGVFDGVHLGHRALLSRVITAEAISAVLTFDPHPGEILRPDSHPRLLTTIDERIELLTALGVDLVGVLDLSEIRMFPPERFVTDILIEKLGLSRLVVGTDFHFGRDRAGDVPFLRESARRHGFEVEVVDLVSSDGVISSSRIREMVEIGDVSRAAALLGSNFTLSNRVSDGDKRGRDLGFPTANLRPPPRKVIPGNGIYAALARVGGAEYRAAVNVGTRPTFGESDLVIEAHLLDFSQDIYGEELRLEFVERLRPEVAFDDVDRLVAQIEVDVRETRRILTTVPDGE
jgi:riboflavin kinase / FMN adenylyltransferase